MSNSQLKVLCLVVLSEVHRLTAAEQAERMAQAALSISKKSNNAMLAYASVCLLRDIYNDCHNEEKVRAMEEQRVLYRHHLQKRLRVSNDHAISRP